MQFIKTKSSAYSYILQITIENSTILQIIIDLILFRSTYLVIKTTTKLTEQPMKKFIKYFSIFTGIFTIFACGSPQEEQASEVKSINTPTTVASQMNKSKKTSKSIPSSRLKKEVMAQKPVIQRSICVY